MDDQLADRLDHIARTPLPWRNTNLTECGHDATKYPTITADDYMTRLRKYGDRRTAFTICQTCAARISVHLHTGNAAIPSLVDRLRRDVDGFRQNDQLERELEAIVALIGNHPDEFDALMAAHDTVARLDQRRAANLRRPRIKR